MKSYNDYGTWIRNRFPYRVQKISIDAGFTCPNRDGSKGRGGCVFCDNNTFNPSYCNKSKTITQQLEEGKAFFARKYPDMKYLAYFQAFSNTYAPLQHLRKLYEEALQVKDVVGLVIATRPDCIDDEKLDYLQELSRRTFLIVEYGVESCNDETLRIINRGHTFECSQEAIRKTHERGITVGAHIILGLPGEDREEIIRQIPLVSSLKIDILKLHQMQIIKGTKLDSDFTPRPTIFSVDEYIALIAEYIRRIRKDIVMERFVSQSPKELLVAPNWGLKNHEFTDKLDNYLKSNSPSSH